MQGHIIAIPNDETKGIIRADDEKRYSFEVRDWKSSDPANVGMFVDFETNDTCAIEIYLVPQSETISTAQLQDGDTPPPAKPKWKTLALAGTALIAALGGITYYLSVYPSGAASSEQIVYYASRLAKVRAAASKESKELGQLARGDSVSGDIVDGITSSAKWLKITVGKHIGGYVSLVNLVTSEPVAIDTASAGSMVLPQDANLLSSPKDGSSIIMHMTMGESVNIIGRTTDGWFEVTPKTGGVAYIKDANIVLSAASAPTESTTPPESSSVASKELFTTLLAYQLNDRGNLFFGKVLSQLHVNDARFANGDRTIGNYHIIRLTYGSRTEDASNDLVIKTLVDNGYLKQVPISGEYRAACQSSFYNCDSQYAFTPKGQGSFQISKANEFTLGLGYVELKSVADYTSPTNMFGKTISEVKFLYKFVPITMLASDTGYQAFWRDVPYDYRKYGGGDNRKAIMVLYGDGWKAEEIRLGNNEPGIGAMGTRVLIK
jgi:uncharacterized protein YgiM (DUF1202 family)